MRPSNRHPWTWGILAGLAFLLNGGADSGAALAASITEADTGAVTKAEVTALKNQVRALMRKIERLEQAQAASKTASTITPVEAPAPSSGTLVIRGAEVQSASATPSRPESRESPVQQQLSVLVPGAFPGSFAIPGTSTSVKLGGTIKLDAITDVGQSYGADFAKFARIPLTGSADVRNQSVDTRFHARQTRLHLETRTPTDLGPMKTYIEADFYNEPTNTRALVANGFAPQVRHAYWEVGPVLAGQTWTTFMDTDAMPETLDYLGPAGLLFVRQGQIRATRALGSGWTVAGSLENPYGDFFATDSGEHAANGWPDTVLRAVYTYDPGSHVAVRALGRSLNTARYDATGTKVGASSTFGYGLAVGGKQRVGDKDAVVYDAIYGDGIGRYIYDVAISGPATNPTDSLGNVVTNGELETIVAYGGHVGYQHVWSDHWRSNVFGGATILENTTSKIPSNTAYLNKAVASGHVNLIWEPFSTYKVGVEYIRGWRLQENDKAGILNRVQASFIYGF